ncbi:OmpA family protein [Pseudomonas sp. PSE14]|uniref:OmpA family protein n=1 Tax=Pseudomonas sp. PSE14 TaxID=3016341 RepID=UPI0023D7DE90|nr:OmpA family protein [Pseudomonas sp. PSE14]WEJ73067.1 OmpA family protein [Pseudomonas sp. PSE14]
MRLKLTRALWTWAALLAVGLLFVIPLAAWQRGLGALVIAVLLLLVWLWAGRQAARHRQDLALADGASLPPAGYRQPVVLVCGDGLRSLFEMSRGDAITPRTTQRGCYLPVDDLDQLPRMVDGILAHRPHWSRQLCVLHVINPGEHADAGALAGQVRAFRHQLALARRRGGALPLLLATYLQSGQGTGSWFSWEAGGQQPVVREAGALAGLAEWQRQAPDHQGAAARLRSAVQLDGLARWLAENVLDHLVSRGTSDPACVATACAIALVPALPGRVAGNLWQHWLQERTALVEAPGREPGKGAALPLPDSLLALLPVTSQATPLRRAGLAALWLFVAAGLVAMASSAWQNTLLARQVSDDLRRYHDIPQPEHRDQPEFAQREAAMTVLREDAARLDAYYRHGEPLHLGLGLYQGERLRNLLLAAITAYRLPPKAPVVAKIPAPVRLDSLSLFAVGSAKLKPESTKVLINALVDIKAQPGWLIVIAGHTDATGNAEHNLELSRARAGAVRDWMQRMGDIPDSCFAVQGFGAQQPIASNDTEIGRAANRRVDIRLVPEVGACVPTAAAPDRKHQSHSAAFNL